jgi:oligosaccharide repeat unit polymerase
MTAQEFILKLAAIVLSLLILGNAFVVRKIAGHWAAPGCIFSIFWLLYTLVPLVIVFQVPIQSTSILYLLAATLAFSASTPFFDWKKALAQNAEKNVADQKLYASRFMRVAFYACGILAMIALGANSYVQNITFGDMVSNFFGSSAQYVGRRYSGELKDNIFISLSTIFSYLAAASGGLVYSYAKSRYDRRTILAIAFCPSAFVMVTQSARGMMFLAIALFIAGYVVVMVAERKGLVSIPKLAGRIALYASLTIPLIAVSFMAKGLHESEDRAFIASQLQRAFVSYIAGHLYAFSDWFSFYTNQYSINVYAPDWGSNGFYTFMAAFRAAGSNREVISGVFEEYYVYDEVLATNIYTMFRGLILDFGLVGSLGALAAGGLICNAGFYYMLSSRRPFVAASFFICAFGYYYTSFIISLFIWNSIFVVFASLGILLWLNNVVSGRRNNSIPEFRPVNHR